MNRYKKEAMNYKPRVQRNVGRPKAGIEIDRNLEDLTGMNG